MKPETCKDCGRARPYIGGGNRLICGELWRVGLSVDVTDNVARGEINVNCPYADNDNQQIVEEL